jgi:hypothetical protein
MFPRRLILSLAASWLALGCSKNADDNCPGLCPDETLAPTMTISTADGAASIARAKVVSGPCTQVLRRSEGEVGEPTGYASVQVIYGSGSAQLPQSSDVPPLCIVTLTSLWGDVESLSVGVKVVPFEKACCPYGTCCPKTEDALTRRYHVEFAQPTQTISFQPGPDAGASDTADAPLSPADTAPLDVSGERGEELDAEGIDVQGMDSAGIDSTGLDLSEIDAASDS